MSVDIHALFAESVRSMRTTTDVASDAGVSAHELSRALRDFGRTPGALHSDLLRDMVAHMLALHADPPLQRAMRESINTIAEGIYDCRSFHTTAPPPRPTGTILAFLRRPHAAG